MKLFHQIRFIRNSLLGKLLASFLAVIFILAAFNFFTFFFLKEKIYNEIINYNQLNMQHTIEGFENQFRLVKTNLVGLSQNEEWTLNLNILRNVKAKNGYSKIDQVKSVIKPLYSNPSLYIENLILHFRNDAYVLEKEGTASSADMFTKYYVSPAYSPGFWNSQFDHDFFFRALPASEFREQTALADKPKGQLLPVMMKTLPYHDMYFIIMLHADELAQAFYYNTNHAFYIVDETGQMLYTSSPGLQPAELPSPDRQGSYVAQDRNYFFYGKGSETGFTYVSIVPVKSISSQLLKLNLMLLTLLLVTILISVFASVLLSLRFNNPIRKMLELMQHRNPLPEGLPPSQIREFDLIGTQISLMLKTNRDITDDLAKKTSLLRNYAYTNKLKSIHMNLEELQELVHTDKPMRFVLSRITFKNKSPDFNQDRATYFIKECIDCIWQQSQQDSVTFQLEKDLVLSLLFAEHEPQQVLTTLEQLQQVLNVDHDLFFLTIAVSELMPASFNFTQAYEQVHSLLKLRRLNGETQIIESHNRQPSAKYVQLPVLQEDEFCARLLTGSEEAVLAWISRCLEELEKKESSAEGYQRFAQETAALLEKSLVRLNLDPSTRLERPDMGELQEFYSVKQFEEWLYRLLAPVLNELQQRPKEQDSMIQFVMEYLEANLEADITLDLLADKLHITPGYLSTYFKSKTGQNFSDYLNTMRMQQAKVMLQSPQYKIKDIAAKVGYQNVNSFIRMFKRYAGITPGEYRRAGGPQPPAENR